MPPSKKKPTVESTAAPPIHYRRGLRRGNSTITLFSDGGGEQAFYEEGPLGVPGGTKAARLFRKECSLEGSASENPKGEDEQLVVLDIAPASIMEEEPLPEEEARQAIIRNALAELLREYKYQQALNKKGHWTTLIFFDKAGCEYHTHYNPETKIFTLASAEGKSFQYKENSRTQQVLCLGEQEPSLSHFYFITPPYPVQSTLKSYLQESVFKKPEAGGWKLDLILKIFLDVLEAYKDLPPHLTHGDLHPDNVLYEPEKDIVFIDFARARGLEGPEDPHIDFYHAAAEENIDFPAEYFRWKTTEEKKAYDDGIKAQEELLKENFPTWKTEQTAHLLKKFEGDLKAHPSFFRRPEAALLDKQQRLEEKLAEESGEIRKKQLRHFKRQCLQADTRGREIKPKKSDDLYTLLSSACHAMDKAIRPCQLDDEQDKVNKLLEDLWQEPDYRETTLGTVEQAKEILICCYWEYKDFLIQRMQDSVAAHPDGFEFANLSPRSEKQADSVLASPGRCCSI